MAKLLHMDKSLAVDVHGLRKSYGQTVAVDELSFTVRRGEVFGLLGPNGAGKSTTLSVLQTLRTPDRGEIRVLGHDPCANSAAIRQNIGVQLQQPSLIPDVTVREHIALFARLYGRNLTGAQLDAALAQVALTGNQHQPPAKLSGGQQQQLSLALALVNDPDLIFLDEPTAGLDAQARRSLWTLIRSLTGTGKSVLLTTHYLEEAEALCDRVAIIDKGLLIASGTPAELIAAHAATTLEDVFLRLTGRQIRD
jgi:ABC-2 type transport system ATP-binding protein